jgi:cell division transport system permease protein
VIPANSQLERQSIGLTTIWGEGEVGHRVSVAAFMRHIVRRALHNLRRSPITVALTVITISVALFLLSSFSLILHNSARAVSRESGELVVMVFLKDSATKSDRERLSQRLIELMPGGQVSYTDKAQALQNFKKLLGDDASMLEGLDAENPLPASLEIRAVTPEQAERLYDEASARFKGDPVVDGIRYSRGGVQQLKRILAMIKGGGIVGIVFLLVITGFIIANTIKLALYGHRMEIEIMQLVGAGRSAIYAPYVIEGFIQGVLGALLAILSSFLAFVVVRNMMARTDILQFIFPTFEFIEISHIGWIIVAGAVVGMMGSFMAVRRFLSET